MSILVRSVPPVGKETWYHGRCRPWHQWQFRRVSARHGYLLEPASSEAVANFVSHETMTLAWHPRSSFQVNRTAISSFDAGRRRDQCLCRREHVGRVGG